MKSSLFALALGTLVLAPQVEAAPPAAHDREYWRCKRLSPAELDALRRRWQANLAIGIGSTGDESVPLRSFSALELSILGARPRPAVPRARG